MAKTQLTNPRGRLSVDLKALMPRLEKLAKKTDTKPTTLGRLLLNHGICELEKGNIDILGGAFLVKGGKR